MNTIVCRNESEYNPQVASLLTLVGEHARKPKFLGCVRSYSYSYYALLEYSMSQARKLQVSGTNLSPLVGMHAYPCIALKTNINTSLVRYACVKPCNAEDLQERRRE